jgi:hypothetical protein
MWVVERLAATQEGFISMELALSPEFSNKRVRLVEAVSASTNGTSFRGLTIRETACCIVYTYEMLKATQTLLAKQVSGP